MTRSIGVRELRARTSEVLRELQETGVEIIITSRGRPVARLEPLSAGTSQPPTDGMGGLRAVLRSWPSLDWADFEAAKSIWEPRDLDRAE